MEKEMNELAYYYENSRIVHYSVMLHFRNILAEKKSNIENELEAIGGKPKKDE